MVRYVLRRLLLMVPTFFGITLFTFGVVRLAPGDPLALGAEAMHGAAGQGEDALAQRRHLEGLDQPLYVQYARWVRRVVTFDFGRSYEDGRTVTGKIAEALPRTLLLTLTALFLSYLIAVPLGTWSAVRQRSLGERIVGLALFVLYSLPTFWVAILLLLFFASPHGVTWFPLQGLTSDGFTQLSFGRQLLDLLWHLVLPVIVLTYGALASISRYMRSGMLEVLRTDYVRTARAKGLSERVVILKHAMRNSVIPLVTIFGLALPQVLGGSVIVEQIFGIPGMGELAFQALLSRDYPMVMGITTLVALITLLSTLISDLLAAAIDPRIDLELAG